MGKDEWIIKHPVGCEAERSYLLRWLFGEILGCRVVLIESECAEHVISLRGNSKQLRVPDYFFQVAQKNWLSVESLTSIEKAFQQRLALPELVESEKDSFVLDVDIFGILFVLLSRYEEAVSHEIDHHGRFEDRQSFMIQNALSSRAIGNELIEHLVSSLAQIWNGFQRLEREFRVIPSHDIDRPSAFWQSSYRNRTKQALANLGKNRSLKTAGLLMREAVQLRRDSRLDLKGDPNDTIDWIIQVSESAGRQSTFYYIPVQTHDRFDAGMPLDHPLVERQWRSIQDAGHQLGVHPGYETYLDESQMRRSVEVFCKQREKMAAGGKALFSRQHYLRWEASRTPSIMEEAGITIDSTVGFPSQAGFRAGICYEYPCLLYTSPSPRDRG